MRRILCPECGAKWPRKLPREDVETGFSQRIVEIQKARKPPGLCITVNGKAGEEFEHLKCDSCDKEIPDGTPCVAVTIVCGELGPWEDEYSQT